MTVSRPPKALKTLRACQHANFQCSYQNTSKVTGGSLVVLTLRSKDLEKAHPSFFVDALLTKSLAIQYTEANQAVKPCLADPRGAICWHSSLELSTSQAETRPT